MEEKNVIMAFASENSEEEKLDWKHKEQTVQRLLRRQKALTNSCLKKTAVFLRGFSLVTKHGG